MPGYPITTAAVNDPDVPKPIREASAYMPGGWVNAAKSIAVDDATAAQSIFNAHPYSESAGASVASVGDTASAVPNQRQLRPSDRVLRRVDAAHQGSQGPPLSDVYPAEDVAIHKAGEESAPAGETTLPPVSRGTGGPSYADLPLPMDETKLAMPSEEEIFVDKAPVDERGIDVSAVYPGQRALKASVGAVNERLSSKHDRLGSRHVSDVMPGKDPAGGLDAHYMSRTFTHGTKHAHEEAPEGEQCGADDAGGVMRLRGGAGGGGPMGDDGHDSSEDRPITFGDLPGRLDELGMPHDAGRSRMSSPQGRSGPGTQTGKGSSCAYVQRPCILGLGQSLSNSALLVKWACPRLCTFY